MTAWTDKENAAVCALYFHMLDKTASGGLNKAQAIRVAQNGIDQRDWDHFDHSCSFAGLLGARSRGSIEAKLMNCSAAHRDAHSELYSRLPHDTMDGHGYRALSNYQASLKVAMRDALQARNRLAEDQSVPA